MAHLLCDENFPLPAAQELRRLGHNVLTLQDAGKGEQAVPDEAVLQFAVQQKRALITLNRKHFIRLHRTRSHTGIIVCTFDPNFVGQANRIHLALEKTPDLAGQLLRINRPQTPSR